MQKFKLLFCVCGVLVGLATSVFAEEYDMGKKELQVLLEHSKEVTVQVGPYKGQPLSKVFADNMLREFSPSGDPTYVTNEFSQTCKLLTDKSLVKECVLVINNSTKVYTENGEQTMDESSYIIKYFVLDGRVMASSKVYIDMAG